MALYEETKQLQEEQNAKFPGVETPKKSFVEAFQEQAHLFKGFNYSPTNPVLETEPIAVERPNSWERRLGNFYNPTLDQENFLAEQQSGLQRIGYMLPRIAVKAASEVAQLPGYLGGAVAWGIHGFDSKDIGLMVNNAYQQKVQEIEQGAKDIFPVYTSDEVKYGNIWDNIFSTSFWANEGADGVGFMLAFLAPGFALRSLGTGAKIARIFKPGTAMLPELEATANAARAGKALATAGMADRIEDVTSTMVNTLFESAAEAGESYTNVLDKTGDKLKAGEAATSVMRKNFGILALSNYLDQKWLFGKVGLIGEQAEKSAKELAGKGVFNRILGKQGEILDQMAKRTRWENIGSGSKAILAGIAKEGFWEEGMQFAAQKRVEEGVPDDDNFISGIVDMANTWAENLTDTDMQKSILLGSVLGTAVPGIGQIREAKAQEKFLGNMHTLLKNNFVDRYRTLSDLAETEIVDGVEKPKTDQDGNYVIDKEKAKEMLAKSIVKSVETEEILHAARTGNDELFEKLKNQRDFNYFMPFLQVEGGLPALLTHIDNLADHDVAAMNKEGLPLNVNDVKKELKDKAKTFQEIYNRVNATHDINFDIKSDPKDRVVRNDFSDIVKNNKLSEEVILKHATNRIDNLVRKLATYKSGERSTPITASETGYNQQLVKELKDSLNENKDKMSATDVQAAEMAIKNVDGHVKDVDESITNLKNLYSKDYLQKEYDSYLSKKKKADEILAKGASEVAKEIESETLAPELKDLYKQATAFEETKSPNKEMTRHSGEGVVSVNNEDGSISNYKLSGFIPNNQGSLTVTILGHELKDKEGKLSNHLVTDKVGVINPDNTFTYQGKIYPINGTVTITKSGDEILKEVQKAEPITPQQKTKEDTSNFETVELTAEDKAGYNPPSHSFSETAGILNWLSSTGNQDQVAEIHNDDLGRWYLFVNNHSYRINQGSKNRYDLKSFTVNQVGQLPVSDPIRKNLKFFAGDQDGVPLYKTYDEIQQLSPSDNGKRAQASDDIKMVAFENDKPLLVGQNGEMTGENRTFLVYSSFQMPKIKGPKGFDKFNLDKARTEWKRNNKITTATLTDTQEKQFRAYIDPKIEQSRIEYEVFRKELKKDSKVLDIIAINPGYKKGIEDKSSKPTDVLEATGYNVVELRKNIKTEARTPGKDTNDHTRFSISGYTYGARNGFIYVAYSNKYEPIKFKTLEETGSVQDIVNLLRHYYSKPGKTEMSEIRKYLETAIYLTDKAPYNLRLEKDKLIFGQNELSADSVSKGVGLDPLRSFLSTKYWNFDNDKLRLEEFSELFVVPDEKAKSGFKLMVTDWGKAEGGYVGFVFSNRDIDGRTVKSKGTIYIRPRGETPLDTARNPQYSNQSVNLMPRGYKTQNTTIPVNNKNTTIPKKEQSSKSTFAQDVAAKLGQQLKTGTQTIIGAIKVEGKKQATKLESLGNIFTIKKASPAPGTPESNGLGDTTPTIESSVTIIKKEPIESNIDEEWKDLGVAQKNFINSAKLENPKASEEEILRIAKEKFNKTLNDLDSNEPPFARDAILYDRYEKENIDDAVAWFKAKFPNLPIEIVEGLVRDKSWGLFTQHSKVLLSSIAEIGTIYHESFHAFSQLVLDEPDRKGLYDEVRRRLNNPNLTDRKAEEILAEEFRSYMLSPSSYSFAKSENNKRNFFQKLLDIVMQFFGLTDKNNIELTFETLKDNTFEVAPKELEEDRARDIVDSLNEKDTTIMIKHMNYTFFQTLLNPDSIFLDDVLFKTNQQLDVVYATIKSHYKRVSKQKNADGEFAKKIVDNFDELINKHVRFLKLYKIDLKQVYDDYEIDENDVDDRSGYTYLESLSVNMNDLIDNNIRMLIAGLPSITKDDSRINETLSEYQARSTARFSNVLNILNNGLAGLGTDPKAYFDKLREMVVTFPEFNILLDRLRADKEVTNRNILLLQNGFVRAFGHHKTNPLLVRVNKDGRRYLHSSTDDTTNRKITNDWGNNLREAVNTDNSYGYTDTKGSFMISAKRVLNDIEIANKTNAQYRDQLNVHLNILRGLGIRFAIDNDRIINKPDVETISNYIKYLEDQIRSNKVKDFPAQDLFNGDVIRNQKEVDGLLKFAQKYFVNKSSLMYYNQEGNRQYPITLNSHTTLITTLLSKIEVVDGRLVVPDEIKYLQPYDGKEGNLFSTNSKWWAEVASGNQIKNVLLSGVTDASKEGIDIHKAKFGDYKATLFNALLKGYFPHIRSAERKLETAFIITDSNGVATPINYSVTKGTFKKDMLKYLEDELVTSFTLLVDPANWGGNLNNYKDNAKRLRVFDFLYDTELNSGEETLPTELVDFEPAIQADKTVDTIVQARTLAKLYLDQYEDYIDRSSDKYIDKLTRLTESSLKEDNVISEESLFGKTKIAVRGIDIDSLKSFGININQPNQMITKEEFNRLNLFVNYRNFIGMNEQLKLILGDLAMFKDKIDFHKRVTGSTSTKYMMADSLSVRSALDRLYPRADRKQHTQTSNIIVVDDIISSNEELLRYFSEYKEIKGTDAISYDTLDGRRDIMIRHGMWGEEYEKTYQYEIQTLAIEMLKRQADGKKYSFTFTSDMFESPSGIFYEHTNGVVPEKPMFKEKEITNTELGIISMQKPQGFGHIANIKGLNATQYWKTATSVLFPSVALRNDDTLSILLDMMANKIDIVAFDSSMKITKSSSEKFSVNPEGNLILSGYEKQELPYNDFGFQLDIHEETSGLVTQSTQRTKLEGVNLFSRGIFMKEDTNLRDLSNKYDNLTNDIVSIRRDNLFKKDLALTISANGQSYELLEENRPKFEERLLNAFEQRLLPQNVVDGLRIALRPDKKLNYDEKVFEVSPNMFDIQGVLMSMVRNNVISRKLPGIMAVQEPSFIYEKGSEYFSNNRRLKFYRKEGDKVLPMQVMMSLPMELIEYTEELGGLKILNEAIASHDTKLLGKDFFKLLQVPMNRIPGQKLSSLDVAEIVEFLPYYHGPKVVLPPEITIKAGSDFDVDKMTSYFKHIGFENGKVRVFTDEKTLEGKENRLMDIMAEMFLHSERFREMIEPVDIKRTKAIAKNIKKKVIHTTVENETLSAKLYDVVSLWYNNQKAYEFWKSKKGTGPAAVYNTLHAFLQKHPVGMNTIVPFYFKGQEIDMKNNKFNRDEVFGEDERIYSTSEKYQSGFIYDSEGQLVSSNLSEFISAFLDAIKDPFIFEFASADNFNVIALLNMYGKETSTGINTIANFISQDSIVTFERIRRSNTPKFMTNNHYLLAESDEIKDLMRRPNYAEQFEEAILTLYNRLDPTHVVKNLPQEYSQTIASLVQQLIVEEDEERKIAINEEIKRRLEVYKYGDKYFSLDDLSGTEVNNIHDQVQILDMYLTYKTIASHMFTMSNLLRADARGGFTSHITTINSSIMEALRTLDNGGIFYISDLVNALEGTEENPSLIKEFYSTKQNITNLLGWSTMIYKDKTISDFFEQEIYPRFGNPNLRQKFADVDKNYKNIESDFMIFVIMRSIQSEFNLTQQQLQAYYKELMSSRNSVARELLTKKGQIAGNEGINSLFPLIAQRDKTTRAITEVDNITMFDKSGDTTDIDAIEQDIYELGITTESPFINRIMTESLLQSGYSQSPNSFMHIIPARLFSVRAKKAVKEFMDLDEDTKKTAMNLFLKQLYRNNVHNSTIVPILQNTFKYNRKKQTYSNATNSYKGRDYLAARYYLRPPGSYFKKGLRPPTGIMLLERIGDSTEFRLKTPMLGDGDRFKEYYPMEDPTQKGYLSFLTLNNYQPIPIDVEYTEPEEIVATDNKVATALQAKADDESDIEEDEDLPLKDQKDEELTQLMDTEFNPRLLRFSDINFIVPTETNNFVKLAKIGKNLEEDNIVPTTVQKMLKHIALVSNNPARRELAKVLDKALPYAINIQFEKDFFENVANRNDEDEIMAVGKFMTPDFVNVNISYKEFINNSHIKIYDHLDDNSTEMAILHEALHALSYKELVSSTEFRNSIKNLMNYVKTYMTNSDDYKNSVESPLWKTILGSPHEFISEGLTNVKVQAVLADIPAENPVQTTDKLAKGSSLTELINNLLAVLKKYFNLIFRGSQEKYNESVTNLTSALTDLVLTVDESTIQKSVDVKEGENPIKEEFVEEDLQQSNRIKESNEFELSKEESKDFEQLYPEYAYMNDVEREAYQDAVNKGEIELACGL